MDDMSDWNDFRKNESITEGPPLYCCECGKKAEGNVSCDDGEICDACHERLCPLGYKGVAGVKT